MEDECEFCLRLHSDSEARPWYDFHVISDSDQFCVVVALGALVPGHLMIVSRVHYECMADLDADGVEELDQLSRYWTALVSKVWSRACFVFEHGGRAPDGGAVNCIAHAHLQIVPLSSDPLPDFAGVRELPSLAEALRCAAGADYLLFRYAGHYRVLRGRSEKGQFFRRVITSALGRPGDWDYLLFPNLEAMRQTVDWLG